MGGYTPEGAGGGRGARVGRYLLAYDGALSRTRKLLGRNLEPTRRRRHPFPHDKGRPPRAVLRCASYLACLPPLSRARTARI